MKLARVISNSLLIIIEYIAECTVRPAEFELFLNRIGEVGD
jgi:hypothetical protein